MPCAPDPSRVPTSVDRLDGLGGGLERWTLRLAQHLRDAGHGVAAVTFHSANHALDAELHVLPWHASPLERGRRIEAALAGIPADVVHDSGAGWSGDVFHPQTGSHLASLEREIGSYGVARRLKAAISPRTRLRRWRTARAERMQLGRAPLVLAVSRRLAAHFAARHGIDPARIRVVPNGAETARFARPRIAHLRGQARASLGVGDRVLFLGSAHNMRLKGMDTAIRAMAGLEGAVLAIAGGEPDRWWRRLAASAGADRVRFLGPVADMAPLFAAADALVHPTRWDACSLSTIEAAAAGLAVVTTAINGAAELIEDGRTGLILPEAGDVEALQAQMAALLDPAYRTRLGDAAAAAAARHDIDVNLRAVEAVLRERAVLREGAGR
jgi:UDP-glucose:(heptosyl)LPS alpha-1,3-glucosyltransferase